jgi:hypothetical protein
MAQDQGSVTGIDPFAKFLMEAYMKGRMPGGPNADISNFNTVLDLLSPGAMAQRAEEEVPDAAEMYANMFGGRPPLPEELDQAMKVQMGIAPGPEEVAEITSAWYEAMGKLQAEQEALAQQRYEFEQGKAGREAAAAKDKALASEAEAEANKRRVETAKLFQLSPDEMAKLFDINVNSLAMHGTGWDFETGKPMPIPEEYNKTDKDRAAYIQMNRDTATKFLQIKQMDPQGFGVVSALINSNQNQAAFAMLDKLYPGMFTTEDRAWWAGGFLFPKTTIVPRLEGSVMDQLNKAENAIRESLGQIYQPPQ